MFLLLLLSSALAQSAYEDGLDLLQYADRIVVAEPAAVPSSAPRFPSPQPALPRGPVPKPQPQVLEPQSPQLSCRAEFLKSK